MITYALKYFSEYSNKNHFFRLEILQNEASITSLPIEIDAYCKLSYKRADSVFSPIRGASLEININSNIVNQYSEFLTFNERTYKVKFLQDNILIFEGFINPTGITQSYSSVNWVARLIATDNLGTLRNLEFIYDNELPNEFVFLDLILKRTGLDLPIAFADSILSDGQPLANTNNRIIDPKVFLNKNGRQTNCEDILKDLLVKYNASICLRNLPLFDINGNFIQNKLCWYYFRSVDLIGFSQFTGQIPTYKINGYTEANISPFGVVKVPTFNIVGLALDKNQAIKSESNVGSADALLVNRNAQIRSINSLQNFRFQQDWVERGSLIDFNNSKLEFVGNPNEIIDSIFATGLNLTRQTYLSSDNGRSLFFGDVNEISNTDANNKFNNFVKLIKPIQLPNKAKNLKINGNAIIKHFSPFVDAGLAEGFSFGIQYFRCFYKTPSNEEYVLKIIWENNTPGNNPETEIGKLWELLSDANLNDTRYYNNFLFFTNRSRFETDVNFDIELPTLVEEGGEIMIELTFFKQLVRGINIPNRPQRSLCIFNELNLIAEPNPELGTGEFHDAIRLNFASTNLEQVQKVINADEPTNLFRNGLKKIQDGTLQNYNVWRSVFENVNYPNLLQLTSLERLKLRRNNSIVVTTDILGYITYGSIIRFLDFNKKYFVILDYQYETINDIIRLEIAEIFPFGNNQNFEYNQSYIIENEVNVLIKE